MRVNNTRPIAKDAPTLKFMNIKVPPHIHARFLQECERLSREMGGRFSLNMLFTRLGNELPPTPDEATKQPPARAAGAAVVRARSA